MTPASSICVALQGLGLTQTPIQTPAVGSVTSAAASGHSEVGQVLTEVGQVITEVGQVTQRLER